MTNAPVSAIFWTVTIGVVAYIFAIVPLFFGYLILQVARLTQLLERQWLKIKLNPDSPWVRAKINSNANRIATQLLNEINGTTRKSDDDGDPR